METTALRREGELSSRLVSLQAENKALDNQLR
jgi:hypothetical protein